MSYVNYALFPEHVTVTVSDIWTVLGKHTVFDDQNHPNR